MNVCLLKVSCWSSPIGFLKHYKLAHWSYFSKQKVASNSPIILNTLGLRIVMGTNCSGGSWPHYPVAPRVRVFRGFLLKPYTIYATNEKASKTTLATTTNRRCQQHGRASRCLRGLCRWRQQVRAPSRSRPRWGRIDGKEPVARSFCVGVDKAVAITS